MEAVVYDDGGQLLTGTFMDYAIPRADDLPPIEVELIEHRSMINELGSRAWRKRPHLGAPAIANAIEDALADLAVSICEVPVTPRPCFGSCEEEADSASLRHRE